MKFIFSEPQTDFVKLIGGHCFIHALGSNEQGYGDKFRGFLSKTAPPPRAEVYIDSPGGSHFHWQVNQGILVLQLNWKVRIGY